MKKMGVLNKLFGNKPTAVMPDNVKLHGFLDTYWKENGEGNTYKNVLMELINGNSFLMFQILKDSNVLADVSSTSVIEKTLKRSSFMGLDGAKILNATVQGSSCESLTIKTDQYMKIRSKDVFKFVQDNGMDRIVIEGSESNKFILERSKENIQEYTIQLDSNTQLGKPNHPLNKSITKKLIENFRKDNSISEVYQYGQSIGDEFSIVLGFKLTENSEEIKKSAINSVQSSLLNESIDQLLDLFFIENDILYNRIKMIENSLLYKKVKN